MRTPRQRLRTRAVLIGVVSAIVVLVFGLTAISRTHGQEVTLGLLLGGAFLATMSWFLHIRHNEYIFFTGLIAVGLGLATLLEAGMYWQSAVVFVVVLALVIASPIERTLHRLQSLDPDRFTWRGYLKRRR